MFHCLYKRGGGTRPPSFYLADDGETVFGGIIVDDRSNSELFNYHGQE